MIRGTTDLDIQRLAQTCSVSGRGFCNRWEELGPRRAHSCWSSISGATPATQLACSRWVVTRHPNGADGHHDHATATEHPRRSPHTPKSHAPSPFHSPARRGAQCQPGTRPHQCRHQESPPGNPTAAARGSLSPSKECRRSGRIAEPAPTASSPLTIPPVPTERVGVLAVRLGPWLRRWRRPPAPGGSSTPSEPCRSAHRPWTKNVTGARPRAATPVLADARPTRACYGRRRDCRSRWVGAAASSGGWMSCCVSRTITGLLRRRS